VTAVEDRSGDLVDPTPDGDEGVSAGVWCESESARAVIATAIRTAVDRLEFELPRARLGLDPEGVHQARVATRRLRSDLRTFGLLLDGDWRDRTRDELTRLASALGAVRDTDVLAARLETGFNAVGADPQSAVMVFDALRRQGDAARRAMIEVFDDDQTAALMAELRHKAIDPPTTLSAVGRAQIRLRPLVRRPWHELDRAVASLDDEPAVSDLHRVRLLAKRTRYATEAVLDVFGRDARRFVEEVRGIQDVLGDMNDASVAVAWLQGVATDLDPAGAFEAGRVARYFDDVADAHRHGWERCFKRARKRSDWLT
jgi:CHAD domain-containing protein